MNTINMVDDDTKYVAQEAEEQVAGKKRKQPDSHTTSSKSKCAKISSLLSNTFTCINMGAMLKYQSNIKKLESKIDELTHENKELKSKVQVLQQDVTKCRICRSTAFPHNCNCSQDYACEFEDPDNKGYTCQVVACTEHQCQPCLFEVRCTFARYITDNDDMSIHLAQECPRHYCAHCDVSHDITTDCPRFCVKCDHMIDRDVGCSHKCGKCLSPSHSGNCTRSANGNNPCDRQYPY